MVSAGALNSVLIASSHSWASCRMARMRILPREVPATTAVIEFLSKQTLNQVPESFQVGDMNISTFTSRERHALARASAIVLATLQADTSRPQ